MSFATATTMLQLLIVAALSLSIVEGDEATDAAVGDLTTVVSASQVRDWNERSYEHFRTEYEKMGCVEFLGDFPVLTAEEDSFGAQNSILTRGRSLQMSMDDTSGGMMCSCYMLYDLGRLAARKNSSGVAAGKAQATAGADCVGGYAGIYPCENVDLVGFVPVYSLPLPRSGEPANAANDVWGWTSSTDREFAIWGTTEGTFFVEIMDSPSNPYFVWGFMESEDGSALQRDIKVIGDTAYVGAEKDNHGIQIFDLNRLLNMVRSDCSSPACQSLAPDHVYRGFGSDVIGNSHNIVANEESGYLYFVGSRQGCNGGLHIVSINDNPLDPKFVGCFGDDGYVHDAHCVKYRGPDDRYQGRDICFCFNESVVTIVDVTEGSNFEILSRAGYKRSGYTHQGWLSSDHKHVVFGDEIDELQAVWGGREPRVRTMILNVENLSSPKNYREHFGKATIDHNQYIRKANAAGLNYNNENDLIFQANYEAGLTILQAINYDEGDLREVGSFDTFLYEGEDPYFSGAWSTFPYFSSGLILISSLREGLFIVKPNLGDALFTSEQPIEPPSKPPSKPPTKQPSQPPTQSPVTGPPTQSPVTVSPTQSPVTGPPTQSPVTVSPTQPPSGPPIQPPSGPPTAVVSGCEDSTTLDYKNKGKGCGWVGKFKGKASVESNRKRIRRKCRLRWKGSRLHKYCPTTCGQHGIGKCKKLFRENL